MSPPRGWTRASRPAQVHNCNTGHRQRPTKPHAQSGCASHPQGGAAVAKPCEAQPDWQVTSAPAPTDPFPALCQPHVDRFTRDRWTLPARVACSKNFLSTQGYAIRACRRRCPRPFHLASNSARTSSAGIARDGSALAQRLAVARLETAGLKVRS